MTKIELIPVLIRVTPEQRQFIRNGGYSLSKLVRVLLNEKMEKLKNAV